ncbi:hypothetical protein ACFFNY_24430 [Paenibacillus hodogayensis]|uniref:Endolytic transglycosylase MltG n=1 Tax=Paenibacillus hodogayensis TaxID=279208 RepID=A0ABV5W2Y5_9BACL
MFKNRLFLYGLGSGIIAGAILLQLTLKAEELEGRPLGQTEPASLAQIQAQADKLNYKLVPKDQTAYSDKDLEALKQKAAEEERARLAKQPGGAAGSSAPVQAPPKAVHSVYISERMDAAQVSDLFAKAGILPDASGLMSALSEKKLTTRIRSGSYTFEGPATVDDILAKIIIP